MDDCTLLADHELLRLLQQDNALAFQELYLRYWDKLFYAAHKRLKSAMAAEEIVQEIFLKLWQKRKELQIQTLPPYLAAMTRYAVYQYLSQEKRMVEKGEALSRLSGKMISGESVMDSKLLLGMIKQLTNELPEKCRLIFIYNKIDDQTLPEVAKKMNISLKTAEAHLTKALRLIRMRMGSFFFL
jgi:RNA polymerase sigma-70 factor (ECF subfamily)